MKNLTVVKSALLLDQVVLEFAYNENLHFKMYGKVVEGKLKVNRGEPWDAFDGRSLQAYVIPNEVYSTAYRQAYAKMVELPVIKRQLTQQLELKLV
jgi:hypothetical protein